MIENLIDAIQSVVTDMQEVVTNTDTTTVSGSVTTFSYTTENNIYVAGMWIEFAFPTTSIGYRYQIATLTQNSRNSYTITINTAVTDVAGIKNVTMRPFIKFKYDSFKNLQMQLIEESKTATKKKNKYPLLFLLIPYKEIRDKQNEILFQSTANLVLIIDTRKDWTTEERLDYSFKQNLHPLYNLLIDKIKNSYLFQVDENFNITHEKTDFYHWSTDEAKEQNKIAAVVDAIEINNIQLILNKQSNC